MNFEIECVEYLTNHSFIRNYSIESFVKENNFSIVLSNYIVFSVGLISQKRIVHAIKFLAQCQSPGVTSYYIEWFNNACFSNDELFHSLNQLESVKFWVHSGVALRKNFFLFEDRMSLFKSTFLFDTKKRCYYRLIHLQPYFHLDSIASICSPMYSAADKILHSGQRKKKSQRPTKNFRLSILQKNLRKVIKHCNTFNYLEESHPRLFEEVTKIINL